MPAISYLRRRGDVYYLRLRIPSSLKRFCPAAERSWTLRTDIPRDARRRARLAYGGIQAGFEIMQDAERRGCLAEAQRGPLFQALTRRAVDDPLFIEEQRQVLASLGEPTAFREHFDALYARLLTERDAAVRSAEAARREAEAAQGAREQAEREAQDVRTRSRHLETTIVHLSQAATGQSVELYHGHDSPMSAFTERYIEARKLSRTSAASHRKAFQRFQEIVGDRPLSEITKNDVVHFVEALEATRSDKREREPLKPATVKKYLSHINGLFKAQLKKNRVRVNPAEDVGITGRTDPQAPADERKPFTPEQLKKIFNAPIFNGCQSASRLTKPGTTKVRDGRFWYVPVMCFTGARNGEVEALSPFDVVKHHDLWHIDINKANKTKAGARLVPIHSELIKMGFLDWVALRRVEAPDETLFEKRKYGRIWNDRILPAAGVKEDLTCTYSFRHNFEDGLKEVVQDETKQRLMGHTTKAMGGRYGNGTVTRAQARAIEKLDYGELDLTYLHKYDSVEEALAHARL